MKKIISILLLFSFFTSCERLANEEDIDIPEVSTYDLTEVSSTTIKVYGEIVSSNVPLDLKGFCWSTNPNPTFEDSRIDVEDDDEDWFSATIENLSPSTDYYVRAFASNEQVIGYGEERKITTEDYPTPPCEVSQNTLTTQGPQYSYGNTEGYTNNRDLYEIKGYGWGIDIYIEFKEAPKTNTYKTAVGVSSFDITATQCDISAVISNILYYAESNADVYVEKIGPDQYNVTACDIEFGSSYGDRTVSFNMNTE